MSLAGAAAPALLLFLGTLALPDTPNSLLERGREEEAHRVLARVRAAPLGNTPGQQPLHYYICRCVTVTSEGSDMRACCRSRAAANLPCLQVRSPLRLRSGAGLQDV